jgi:hypothetical protein
MRFNHITPDIFKNRQDTILYSCIPECEIYYFGLRNINRCICDAFAFGSMKVMKRYCNTYNFILSTNDKLLGNYCINYELCLTESYLNEIFNQEQTDDFSIRYMSAFDRLEYKVEYFSCPYILNKKRRSRDTVIEVMRLSIK